jgi:hypothetical protein
MKRILKLILIIGVIMVAIPLNGQTKALPDEITTATKNADSQALSVFFNEKIELITPDKSGVYSKDQAEQVLKSFFDSHPVTSFQIIHQGVKDDSSFAIGIYVSKSISYRFYFRIKEASGKIFIQQLWIENQDEQ